MLLCICDSVFFVSDPWMNVFTWSSDDNALVANFAFPAPLRDESLLAPFDIAIEIRIWFFNARGPMCKVFLEYEIVWNCMKWYEMVWNCLWKKCSLPRGVASVARPECYDQQMPAHLSKWLAWQIHVTDVVGQRVESVWISWVVLEHLLYSPMFVLTAKRKIQPIAGLLQGLKQGDVLLVTLMGPNSAGYHWKDTQEFLLHRR